MDFITLIFIKLKKNGYFYDYMRNKPIKMNLEVIEYIKNHIKENMELYINNVDNKQCNSLFEVLTIIFLDFNLI